ITADTFSDCLIHPKKSSEWGWREDYIEKLRKHLLADGSLIPSFDLGVWLFRSREWPEDVEPDQVRQRVFEEYGITKTEREALFDLDSISVSEWLSDQPISEDELFQVIGKPPVDLPPEEGAALRYIDLIEVGPAKRFYYK